MCEILKAEIPYLGCHELRGSAKCTRRASIPHILLTQAIIGDLDMAIQCQENIIKLQVTVYDAILVKVFQRKTHFRSVKPGNLSAPLFPL